MLLRNRGVQGANNHWLELELRGAGPINRDAVGARVRLVRTDGLILIAEVQAGASLGSTNMIALDFGLGEAELSQIAIRWPDGVWEAVDIDSLTLDAHNMIQREG